MKDRYKICFIGLGSIAERHIKNVAGYLQKRNIPYQIDVLRSGRGRDISNKITSEINGVYYRQEGMPRDYDILFITNPTHLHYSTLKTFHDYADNFFIEKPVWDLKGLSASPLALSKDKNYYVACPLRYTNVIRYLKEDFDLSKAISVQCTASSYLPDWRKGQDYRKSYSAHRDMGGGVAIDLIHEWDYLYYLFGRPAVIKRAAGRFSELEIDSEDLAVYIVEYPQRIIELHLDYFGRTPMRQLLIRTNEETVIADMLKSRITFLERNETVDLYEERDSFQTKEISHFFDIIEGRTENTNTIGTATEVLKMTQGVL